MSGFNPVGSTPVGAISGTTPGGNAYTPATGALTFSGSVPDLSTGTAEILPVLTGMLARESLVKLSSPETGFAVGMLARESLVVTPSPLAIGLLVRETLLIASAGGSDDTMISIIW